MFPHPLALCNPIAHSALVSFPHSCHRDPVAQHFLPIIFVDILPLLWNHISQDPIELSCDLHVLAGSHYYKYGLR